MASVKAVLFTLSGLRARLAARPWPRFRMIYKRQQKPDTFTCLAQSTPTPTKTYQRKSSMMRINPRNARDTCNLPRGSKTVPQRVQKRPKGHQNDPKGWPKRCQETSKIVKEPPRGPKGLKSTPKGYQRCPKRTQRLPNGAQKGAKKGPQKGAKRGSRRGP